LDGDQPRLVTSRIITSLVARLAAATDPTQTLRVLAEAELPRENAIYAAHLATAEPLAGALRGRNWQVLDQLATSADDAEGSSIIAVLQRAARHDEHEIPLAEPLRKADKDALDLIMSRTRAPHPDVQWSAAQQVIEQPITESVSPGNRFRASDVPVVLEKIHAAVNANPDATFEIIWRVVTD